LREKSFRKFEKKENFHRPIPLENFHKACFFNGAIPLNTCKNTQVNTFSSENIKWTHASFFWHACSLELSRPLCLCRCHGLLQQADQYEPRKRRRTQSVSKTWLMEEQARLAEDFHIIRTLLAAEARPHLWRCVCFLHAMCAYMQEDKCLPHVGCQWHYVPYVCQCYSLVAY